MAKFPPFGAGLAMVWIALFQATASLEAMPQAEPRVEIPVGPEDPSLGPSTAPVTIVVFGDFECPFCQRLANTLKRVRERYPDRVRVFWKDYPLTRIHPHAFGAAVAGRCAFEQGRFWEYHNRLYGNQRALDAPSLKVYAQETALDLPRFAACVDSDGPARTVHAGVDAAMRLGLTATPTSFVNGRMVKGAKPLATFSEIIDEELSRSQPATR